ncbi:nucleolin 1-like [Papaver somniferum]|uniref:nucleolin 1-like n=1 Tax=Papaver somniferum TaxID=3469 RepID=UPI000E701D80|nr:nucleolin 1-like [Papaver somniferum]
MCGIIFFENVGDIVDVHFSRDKYQTTLRRVSHVEFASEEAAKETVKWNGRDSLGCPVRLGIVRDSLCVQGLDTSLGIDKDWI